MKTNILVLLTSLTLAIAPANVKAAPQCKKQAEFSCEIIFPIPIPICKVKVSVVCS